MDPHPSRFEGLQTLRGEPFSGAVAGLLVQAERALVAGGGFAEVAHVVLGVPQAVPHMSL